MAGQSARQTEIGVNAHDLSGYFKGYDSSWEIGLEDTTTFAAARTAKSWTLLLEEAAMTLTGFWDQTATTGVNTVIRDALASATKAIVTLWPTGDAVGEEGVAMEADLGSRPVSGAVESVITIGAEFRSSTGEEDVVCLHGLTEETLDGDGDTVDNGAATSNGGSAFLEVSDVTTDNTVTLRGSTDNFVANDTLLGSFTLVNADYTTERIELSGTIPRYVRASWNLTGNSTFRVALNRK